MKYDFRTSDRKWQDRWDAAGVFKATEDHTKPKFYALVEFPYPSGAGNARRAYQGLFRA